MCFSYTGIPLNYAIVYLAACLNTEIYRERAGKKISQMLADEKDDADK